MGNSLLKSDRALMSYWSNMPPVPSFQTTFTYERIPILDYNSLVPMQTTLLVDLSRSVNGETFLHKIYFTNIQPRVVEPLSETTTVQGLSRPQMFPYLQQAIRKARRHAAQIKTLVVLCWGISSNRNPLLPRKQCYNC